MPRRRFPGLIVLTCLVLLCAVRPALAADIDTAAKALDRLLAQMPPSARTTVAVSGEAGPRQGEVVLTLDARTVRLGRGPGWLFGLTLPDGEKRVASVAADGSSRFTPTTELPAGLSPISLPTLTTTTYATGTTVPISSRPSRPPASPRTTSTCFSPMARTRPSTTH